MSAYHLNKDSFEKAIANVALVDFWASWCMPCKNLGPTIEELANEMEGKVIVGKIDIDEEQDLTQQFGVMSVPTVVLFKDGKEVDRLVGNLPKQKYLDALQKLL